MAYVTQDKKKELEQKLQLVLPKPAWKWTTKVRHSSTLVLTIMSGPVDLIESALRQQMEKEFGVESSTTSSIKQRRSFSPNIYYIADAFDTEARDLMVKVKEALNAGNHDKSDIQSDYFDVGWYVDINIGRYDDPFIHVLPKALKSKSAASWSFGKAPKKKLSSGEKGQLMKYLPDNFDDLSAGKKAAATKKAKYMVSLYGG